MSENTNTTPDVAVIDRLENLNQVNERLRQGWVLLGISYFRESFEGGAFRDHETYIIGLRR